MERSKLEKASWIAGIISALIALYVIIAPSKQSDSPNTKAPTIISSSEKQIPATAQPAETDTSINSARQDCKDNPNIKQALKVALTISSSFDRDKALKSLVKDALMYK
jgi:hypothetical protein